jgi:hypothetical protein
VLKNHTAGDNISPTSDDKSPVETLGANGFGRFSLVLVILALTILSAGFGLLYYGLNAPSEGTKFWAPNILNLLLLVVIVIQAGIYWRQWNVMERAIDEGRISRVIENRAFIGVRSVKMSAPITGSEKIVVTAYLENTGKTPARNVRARMYTELVKTEPAEHKYRHIPPEKQSQGILMPGGEYQVRVDFSESEAKLWFTLMQDGNLFYAWGDVLYEDMFNQRWETRFCFLARKPDETVLCTCPTRNHNTIE